MRNTLRISTILVVVLVLMVAVVGCSSGAVSLYGNLAVNASIAYQSGTQSDAISLIDGRSDTKWKGDASGDEPVVAILSFSNPIKFNKIVIDEDGEKISGHIIEVPVGDGVDNWRTIYKGNYLSEDGVLTFESVTASQIRIKITDSDGNFAIREIGIYNEEFGETQPTKD